MAEAHRRRLAGGGGIICRGMAAYVKYRLFERNARLGGAKRVKSWRAKMWRENRGGGDISWRRRVKTPPLGG